MTINNENPKPTDNMELLKQQASACGSECGCQAPKAAGKMRWVLGALVLVAAGAMVVKAIIKANAPASEKAAAGFAALPTKGQPPVPEASTLAAMKGPSTVAGTKAIKTIGALSELNAVAADMDAVFVFVPGTNEAANKSPAELIQAAVRTIEAQSNNKVGIFTLKMDSPDYGQITAQLALPGVLAMVKGRGMVPVPWEITEQKLIQAFVAASNGGSCGAGGCGPAGCCN